MNHTLKIDLYQWSNLNEHPRKLFCVFSLTLDYSSRMLMSHVFRQCSIFSATHLSQLEVSQHLSINVGPVHSQVKQLIYSMLFCTIWRKQAFLIPM